MGNKKRDYILAVSLVLSSESIAISSFMKRQLASSRETLKISLPAPDWDFPPMVLERWELKKEKYFHDFNII